MLQILLSLLHLDDLALAQLEGEWLQQVDRILIRLQSLGMSCWLAKQSQAQRPGCWQDASVHSTCEGLASSQHNKNAACWQVMRALQQRRPAHGQLQGQQHKSTGSVYLAPVTAAVKFLAIAGKGACVVHIHCLACTAVAQAFESHADTEWPFGNF